MWTFGDAAGTVTTTAWFNEGTDEWQRYHRVFDGRGNVTKQGGDSLAALQQIPVIWRGLRQDEVSDLYLVGVTGLDPKSDRYLSQAAPGDSNPYRFEGNRPTSPEPTSVTVTGGEESRGIIRTLIGDETLVNASDAQVIGAVTVFSVGTVLTAGLGVAAVGGGLTIGTVALSGSTTAGLALSTASLTLSGTRVAITGGAEGKLDLALDTASLGIAGGLGVARGLTRGGLLLADTGLNAFQGVRSSALSYQSFTQGDYLGGTLNALGGLLGFAGAGFRGAEFNAGFEFYLARQRGAVLYSRFDAGLGDIRFRQRGQTSAVRGFLTGPSQGQLNAAGGNSFQDQVLAALGVRRTRNAFSLLATQETRDPDLPIGVLFGVTDVKRVRRISNRPQLKAFATLAQNESIPFNLIISPRTEIISEPVQLAIARTGGRIFEFLPESQTFRNVDTIGNRVIR